MGQFGKSIPMLFITILFTTMLDSGYRVCSQGGCVRWMLVVDQFLMLSFAVLSFAGKEVRGNNFPERRM